MLSVLGNSLNVAGHVLERREDGVSSSGPLDNFSMAVTTALFNSSFGVGAVVDGPPVDSSLSPVVTSQSDNYYIHQGRHLPSDQGNKTLNLLSEDGYHISAFFLLFIGTFGMFNNLAVLIVMAKNKQLRSPLNLFLMNLAVSDLGISVVGNPPSLLSALNHGWYFSNVSCIVYAFLMSLFGITSICTLMVLSFERYMMISRPWKSSELTHRNAFLIICGIWAYSFLTTSPPLAGWGAFGIEGPGISCSVDWGTRSYNNTSYILFMFGLGLGVPLMIMGYSYTNVICTLRQAGNSGIQAGVARAERRVAFMVVVMGFTFLIAWTPYAVISLIVAFGDPSYVTPGVAVAPAVFAKSSCMYNPIIYVGLNTQFRSAWSRILCCTDQGSGGVPTGFNTDKVSLTVYTDQSPQPDSAKVHKIFSFSDEMDELRCDPTPACGSLTTP